MISQFELLIGLFGVLAIAIAGIVAWRYVTVRAGAIRETDAAREKALREGEMRFLEFAKSASDWLWEMDKDFKFTYFSNVDSQPHLLSLIGKARWEAAGVDPETDEYWRKHKQVLEAHEPYRNFAMWYRASDPDPRYVVSAGRPICDKDGMFQGYRGTAYDGTEQKRIEERLKATESLFEAILDNAPAIVAIRDRDGRYELVNKTYERIYGMTNEEIRGKLVYEIFTEEHAEIIMSMERRVLESGKPLVEEQPAAPIGGREGTLISIRFPIPDASGEITRVGTIATDITAQKHVEQALRTAKEEAEFANRAKSEFLAKMSHELRTPLNAIIGFAQVMSGEMFGPMGNDRYQQYVNDIGVSGEHLLGLISDLLDISKIESGEVELAIEQISLQDIIDEASSMTERALLAKGHQLAVDIPGNLPDLQMDGRSLRQILVNVISNAIKFTESGGKIGIAALPSGKNEVQLWVSDTGVGIRADELEAIRTPFYQGENAKNSTEAGTGLGLTIVDSLVAMNGGRMSMESQPGFGTIVKLHLPVFEEGPYLSDQERDFSTQQQLVGRRLVSHVRSSRRRRSKK